MATKKKHRFMLITPKKGMIKDSIVSGPNAMETWTIMRAQSLLTKNGKVGPILPYEEAKKVVHDHEEAQREQFQH